MQSTGSSRSYQNNNSSNQQAPPQQPPPPTGSVGMRYRPPAAMVQHQMMAAPQHYFRPPHYNDASSGENKTIWVGDLLFWMDEMYLSSCFASTGEIANVKVIRDKHTNASKGYGFVEFFTHATAEKVLQNYRSWMMPYTQKPFHLKWAFSMGHKRADGNTNHSKGYGFVSFGDDNERTQAMAKMNGVYCSTRPMCIGLSTPQTSLRYQQGDSVDAIAKATEKTLAINDEAGKSPANDFSHFISLPLFMHTELIRKLTRFKSTVLEDCHSEDAGTENTLGINEFLFSNPETFHITVQMLRLQKEELVRAAEVLQNVTTKLAKALDNRPLFVRLKGMACMKGSWDKAQVLHLPVEEVGNEGRLLRACQIIIDAYVSAGLLLEKDVQKQLKFHVTVMNTVFRRWMWTNKHFKEDTFDARGIFERFGSECWGEYHIREAHLSQRFARGKNGYYPCCAILPFPKVSEVPDSSALEVESLEVSVAESL